MTSILRRLTRLFSRGVSHPWVGTCEHCNRQFAYELFSAGMSDMAFGYCDQCGRTALLSAWHDGVPPEAGLRVHRPLNRQTEEWLRRCECGGAFRGTAFP